MRLKPLTTTIQPLRLRPILLCLISSGVLTSRSLLFEHTPVQLALLADCPLKDVHLLLQFVARVEAPCAVSARELLEEEGDARETFVTGVLKGLRFEMAKGDVVELSGLPGSGKSVSLDVSHRYLFEVMLRCPRGFRGLSSC